jgi:glucuronokinase
MIIKTKSYARAGLLGNPSDGYFGKTISFTMTNFEAEVELWESPEINFLTGHVDDSRFTDIDDLLLEISLYGYYGGIRLLKATTKVFVMYCRQHGIELPDRNFTVRYRSEIPRLVGLGGSSALCTAMFRALLEFYEIEIQTEIIPTLCLQAEKAELSIQAGLQDRVIQVYDGVMFMDFDEKLIKSRDYGNYTRVDLAMLPNIYIAYDRKQAESSGIYHQNLRVLFEQHDETVVNAMHEFAGLAQEGYDSLIQSKPEALKGLIDRNFDLRDRIFTVSDSNRAMVFAAREAGASGKFAGSGGAIVGTYEDDAMLQRLTDNLERIQCTVVVPDIPASDK